MYDAPQDVTADSNEPTSSPRQSAAGAQLRALVEGGESQNYQRNILPPSEREREMLIELERERNLLRNMQMRRELDGLQELASDRLLPGRERFHQDTLPGLAPMQHSGRFRDQLSALPPQVPFESQLGMSDPGSTHRQALLSSADQTDDVSASQRRLEILRQLVKEEEEKLHNYQRLRELQSFNERLRDQVTARRSASAYSLLQPSQAAVGTTLLDILPDHRTDYPSLLARETLHGDLGPSRFAGQHGSILDLHQASRLHSSHVTSREPESLHSTLSLIHQQPGRLHRSDSTAEASLGSGRKRSLFQSQSEAAKREASPSPVQEPLLLAPGEGLSLSSPGDAAALSEYQQVIRRSLELFEAQPNDIFSNTQGRKKNVEAGQVGLRCSHCAHRPAHWRGRGAVYFPGSLSSVYQAAQNMTMNHLLGSCEDIPQQRKKEIEETHKKQEGESKKRGGKKYWAEDCARFLTQVEGRSGLWFRRKEPQKRLKTADEDRRR